MVEEKSISKTVDKKDTVNTPQISGSKKVAIVLVRGKVGLSHQVKETLKLLRLSRKNNCVVVDPSPMIKGMLQKVKDFVTWGEINNETFKELIKVRGVEFLGRTQDTKAKYTYKGFFEFSGKKYHKTFTLNPPKKGFGRKGIKTPFKLGGALGYRATAMEDLLKRMI
jgi:large subunit ribosomal protein L30